MKVSVDKIHASIIVSGCARFYFNVQTYWTNINPLKMRTNVLETIGFGMLLGLPASLKALSEYNSYLIFFHFHEGPVFQTLVLMCVLQARFFNHVWFFTFWFPFWRKTSFSVLRLKVVSQTFFQFNFSLFIYQILIQTIGSFWGLGVLHRGDLHKEGNSKYSESNWPKGGLVY